MKKHTYETLLQYLKSLTEGIKVTEQLESRSFSYQLIKDGEKTYLLPLLQEYPNIYTGYHVKKEDQTFPLTSLSSIAHTGFFKFDDDSIFILHDLDGPTIFKKQSIPYSPEYYVHGFYFFKEEEFNNHSMVVAHKNKLSLKKKIKDLK